MVTNIELLGSSVIITATVVIYVRHLLSPKPIPGIPHRPITSILGDIPAITEVSKKQLPLLPHFFEKYALEYGPIYQVLIGPSPLVILSDPYEIEDILLRTRSKSLDASDKTIDTFGGINPYGQVSLKMDNLWRKHRRLGGPSMSAKFLKQMTPRIAGGAQGLVNYWKDKMTIVRQKGGTCFDISVDFQMCTMDAITQIAFAEEHSGIEITHAMIHAAIPEIDVHGGATYPSIKGTPLHQAVNHHFHAITSAYGIPPFLVRHYWRILRLTPTFRKQDGILRNTIKLKIEQAKVRASNVLKTGGSDDADCILDMIVEKDMTEGGEAYTDDELMDEMVSYVFGGYDTSSSALSFGVKFLMNNPQVQLKLREELTSNLSEPENRALTYEEIDNGDKTPYLEAVVNEVLRCGLVAGGMGRRAQEDMIIHSKFVPKGTELLFLTGFVGIHATKKWGSSKSTSDDIKPTKGLWNDEGAAEFIPERWLTDRPDGTKVFSPNAGYSIPFGLGAKACFGQRLAVLEIKVFLATLSLAFYFDKVPQELNGDGIVEVVTSKPEQCYLNLVEWEDYFERQRL